MQLIQYEVTQILKPVMKKKTGKSVEKLHRS